MTMRFTGERVLPDLPEMRVTYLQSLAAYRYAAAFASSRRVLDCGCGEGYGSALLADASRSALGLDADVAAARWAGTKYRQHPALRFAAAECSDLPVRDHSIDLITCFQVIEHLPHPDRFLSEAARVLSSDGILMITTPNRLVVGERPNPHHAHDYEPGDLHRLLAEAFDVVEMLGVYGSDNVLAYRAQNDRAVKGLLRFDPLGLRRVLPAGVSSWLHATATRMLRGWLHRRTPDLVTRIGPDDFSVRRDDPAEAIDLLAICRRS